MSDMLCAKPAWHSLRHGYEDFLSPLPHCAGHPSGCLCRGDFLCFAKGGRVNFRPSFSEAISDVCLYFHDGGCAVGRKREPVAWSSKAPSCPGSGRSDANGTVALRPAPSRRPRDQRCYRHFSTLTRSLCVADSETALFCCLSSQVGESYERLDFFDAFAESNHLVRKFAG